MTPAEQQQGMAAYMALYRGAEGVGVLAGAIGCGRRRRRRRCVR